MLYTVTLNPALDYIMEISDLKPGKTNRARSCRMTAGGKGINVSLMAYRLGYDTVPLGICAGVTGQYLLSDLKEKGLSPLFVITNLTADVDSWTRINVKLSGGDGQELEVNAQGNHLTEQALETLTESLARVLKSGDTLALCGSLPAGAPSDTYANLVTSLAEKGVDIADIRLAVDATDEALKAVLPLHPFVVKPNREELEKLTGLPCRCEDEQQENRLIWTAAHSLQDIGARHVLVSLGERGALLVTESGIGFRIGAVSCPRDGNIGNSTGAGDSMLAGFLCACDSESPKSLVHALRFASACGAATAFTLNGIADADSVSDYTETALRLPVTTIRD